MAKLLAVFLLFGITAALANTISFNHEQGYKPSVNVHEFEGHAAHKLVKKQTEFTLGTRLVKKPGLNIREPQHIAPIVSLPEHIKGHVARQPVKPELSLGYVAEKLAMKNAKPTLGYAADKLANKNTKLTKGFVAKDLALKNAKLTQGTVAKYLALKNSKLSRGTVAKSLAQRNANVSRGTVAKLLAQRNAELSRGTVAKHLAQKNAVPKLSIGAKVLAQKKLQKESIKNEAIQIVRPTLVVSKPPKSPQPLIITPPKNEAVQIIRPHKVSN